MKRLNTGYVNTYDHFKNLGKILRSYVDIGYLHCKIYPVSDIDFNYYLLLATTQIKPVDFTVPSGMWTVLVRKTRASHAFGL